MAFWCELLSAEHKAEVELPALTDATVATGEKRLGVKLPLDLLQLLRSRNGGIIDNSDFKFQGEVCDVVHIRGLEVEDSFRTIRPSSQFMDESDPLGAELARQLRAKAGDLSRLLLFADGDVYWYALDYNHLNAKGEPTILKVLTDEDCADCRRVADSFTEFRQCQYFGDPEPTVQLEEARKLKPIAEGSYSGKSLRTQRPVQISWNICSLRSRIIVFSSEDWGMGDEGAELTRAELLKSSLCFGGELTEQNVADLGPELVELVRPHVEAESIQPYDVGVTPACYSLRLDVQPQRKPVQLQVSKRYKGRWKNNSYQVVCATVYSADSTALEQAMITLAKSCQSLRRLP